jgi:hypothetical protein
MYEKGIHLIFGYFLEHVDIWRWDSLLFYLFVDKFTLLGLLTTYKKLKSHRSSKYASRYFRMIASPDLLCSCTGYQDMISHDSAREIGATTEKVYDVYYFWAM